MKYLCYRAASVKCGSGSGNPPVTPNSCGNSPIELSQSSQEEALSNVILSDNAERSANTDLNSLDHYTLIALNEAQFKGWFRLF